VLTVSHIPVHLSSSSHAFKGAELNYPVHEKELLAIIRALGKWRTDLLGYTFEVWTDHKTLEHFNTQCDLSRRQARLLHHSRDVHPTWVMSTSI
jgi:hypothetical protein